MNIGKHIRYSRQELQDMCNGMWYEINQSQIIKKLSGLNVQRHLIQITHNQI